MPTTDGGYVGEIFMAGFNFAPLYSAFCQGQILPISQNQALFALLGTTFGGDGVTNFQLPNLAGRVPMGYGNGPGLTPKSMGQTGGTETVTLTINNMPAHTHTITVTPRGVTDAGDTSDPTNAYPANTGALDREYKSTGNFVNMGAATGSAGVAGGSQPHTNLPPFLVLNFCILLEGIFPQRN